MTRVKKAFIDRESGERFQPGDTYPAATPERIAELQGSGHLGRKAAEDQPDPLAEYARPGGMYEFSNPESDDPIRIRGREAALQHLSRL